jgi:hypothetical protein
LVRTQTQASGAGQVAKELSAKDGINYNLIKCIFILFKEQKHLWKWFVVLLVASLAGGGTMKSTNPFDKCLLFHSNIPCSGYLVLTNFRSFPVTPKSSCE